MRTTGNPVVRVQTTVLYNSLQAAGINESLVAVGDERVHVDYRLPGYAYDGDSTVNESIALELQRFVVGAAADVGPHADRLVIVQYDVGVREHGTEAVLFEELVAFEAGVHYTLLFVGTPEAPSMIVVEDDP